jgi:hypothetical protein
MSIFNTITVESQISNGPPPGQFRTCDMDDIFGEWRITKEMSFEKAIQEYREPSTPISKGFFGALGSFQIIGWELDPVESFLRLEDNNYDGNIEGIWSIRVSKGKVVAAMPGDIYTIDYLAGLRSLEKMLIKGQESSYDELRIALKKLIPLG